MAMAPLRSALRKLGGRWRRLVSCAGACIAVASCGGTAVNPDALTVAAEPARAVVIGWGGTAAENARAALTPDVGTRVSMLVVSKAGDVKISFGENVARLPPGEYDLTIACGLYIGYRYFQHDAVIHAALSARRVYRLRAAPQGRRCQPFLEDATGAGG